jgi:probable blue pigment (indigoidine) exporter
MDLLSRFNFCYFMTDVSGKMKRAVHGMGFIGITVVLWSMIEVITKLIHSALPPMTIAYLRFVFGGIFLLPLVIFYWKKVNWKVVTRRDWVVLVLLSFLGISCTFSLYHIALYWIDASSTATLIAMVPLIAAPVSYLLLGERMGLVAVIGLLIGAAGVLMIYFSEESGANSLVAVCILIVAVFCFSVYAVMMKPLNKKMDARVTTSLSLLMGGIMMIPIVILDGAPLFRTIPTISWVHLFFLSFVAVGLAYLLYFMGLERVQVSTGNSLMYLKPMLATLFAWVILGDEPSLIRIIAIVVVSTSVFMVVREKLITARSRLKKSKD